MQKAHLLVHHTRVWTLDPSNLIVCAFGLRANPPKTRPGSCPENRGDASLIYRITAIAEARIPRPYQRQRRSCNHFLLRSSSSHQVGKLNGLSGSSNAPLLIPLGHPPGTAPGSRHKAICRPSPTGLSRFEVYTTPLERRFTTLGGA